MDRLTPEIEKAYRNWRRSLDDVTGARIIIRIIKPLKPSPARKPADARGRHKRSPEVREKMRQAALKRWAKKRAA